MINRIKGTKDVLPQESYKWHYVENTAKEVARLFCVREIRTPVFEGTELFHRSIGEGTDVVSKEMYTFTDKGDRSITLKPEGTAPVMRAYIENALEQLSLPLKTYYFIPAFRYENTQSGRYREFHQFGVEIIGGSTPELDFEAISFAHTLISNLKIKNAKLGINSLGCPACRAKYTEALKAYFEPHLNGMCKNCRERFEKNPLRLLDCKVETCKNIAKGAPEITDYLCGDCVSHMDRLKELLDSSGIEYNVDPDIVRGLDYYTKTVFEFSTDLLGSQGQIFGGGRYDNLVEEIGGKPTGCVGFAAGMERIIMLMEASGVEFPEETLCTVYVMPQADAWRNKCIEIVRKLRGSGISADTDMTGKSLKAQFKFADKIKASYAVVIGESEMSSGIINIKNLADGSVAECGIDKIADYIKEKSHV